MHQPRRVKALRGTLTAAFAVAVALLFHVLAGGAMPGPAGVLIPLALALPVCVAISIRRLSLVRLSVSVLASQALFHTLFVFGTVPFAQHEGHQHGAPTMAGVQLPQDVHQHTGHFDGGTMIVAHIIAAALTVLALHRGESAARAIFAAARRVFQRAVSFPEAPQQSLPPRAMPANRHVSVTPRLCPLPKHARRGPPALLAQ